MKIFGYFNRVNIAALLAVLLSSTSMFAGQWIGFYDPVRYPAGYNPFYSAAGDFNGDGKIDLVSLNSNSISLFSGNGDGTFQKSKLFPFPQYYSISGGTGTDLNEDGLSDLIASVESNVAVLLGRTDGSFERPVLYPLPHKPANVVAADFNGDLHMDIAIADDIRYTSSPMLYVALGDGSGRLQRYPRYTLPSRGNSIAVADFNEDGKPDLAFASDKNKEGIGVLLGNGDGSFYPARLYPNGGGARSAHVGDFNGDGHADIFCLAGPAANVLLGHGDGTFNPKPVISPVGDAGPVAVSDFDNNGIADITVALWPNTLAVLLGDGTGRLTLFAEYQVGKPLDAAGFPVTADFNGDGFSDMAVPITGTRFVMSVQINSGVQ